MIEAIVRFLRWLILGTPQRPPQYPRKPDLTKHDDILSRMEQLRDPVTRRTAGPLRRRPIKRSSAP